eukprot:11120457-Alexandrium_andersonii.AAC.1
MRASAVGTSWPRAAVCDRVRLCERAPQGSQLATSLAIASRPVAATSETPLLTRGMVCMDEAGEHWEGFGG